VTARRRRRWAVAAAVVLVAGSGAASAETTVEANLTVVGRLDPGASTLYGDVAVVGTTAIVATQATGPAGCPTASATVVDVKVPRHPRVVATIPVAAGMTVSDVDALDVATTAFTGDLVALALTPLPGPCGDSTVGMVTYHDLSDPSQPGQVGRSVGCPACGRSGQSVSLAQRKDGRVVAARTDAAGVAFDDVSDPAHPLAMAPWPAPPAEPGGCGVHGVVLHDDGLAALVTLADGRVYDLVLADPTAPPGAGDPAPPPDRPGGAAGVSSAVVPLGNRTIAIVSERDCDPLAPPGGLRVLTLDRAAGPRDEDPVRYPGGSSPGRLVASGAFAYVAWHGDGVRVVDFGEVRPRTVARFVPAQPDVVGVALLPANVVVTDSASGLYVLERPDEGGGRAAFWSQFLSLMRFLVPAVLLAGAFALVPRLATRGVGADAPVATPSRVRRRA
jgi:hypothetical protein